MLKVKLTGPIISQTPITNDRRAVCGWAPRAHVLTAWLRFMCSVAMVVLCGIKRKDVVYTWHEYGSMTEMGACSAISYRCWLLFGPKTGLIFLGEHQLLSLGPQLGVIYIQFSLLSDATARLLKIVEGELVLVLARTSSSSSSVRPRLRPNFVQTVNLFVICSKLKSIDV